MAAEPPSDDTRDEETELGKVLVTPGGVWMAGDRLLELGKVLVVLVVCDDRLCEPDRAGDCLHNPADSL